MRTQRLNCLSIIWMTAAVIALCGCRQEDQIDQLQHWIAQARHDNQPQGSKSALPPLAVAQEFHAYPYLTDDFATPFSDGLANEPGNEIKADEQRPPQRGATQFLEGFALESMRMVGTLARNNERQAVLHVGGDLHRVEIGDYLGKQFGRIEHISEDAIALQELSRDTDGTWIAHNTNLTMNNTAR